MPNSKLAGCVRTATDADHTVRAAVNRAWAEIETEGVCPTCREIETGEATATDRSLLLFEDEHSFAVLERPLAAAIKQALERQSGSQGAGPVSVEDSR